MKLAKSTALFPALALLIAACAGPDVPANLSSSERATHVTEPRPTDARDYRFPSDLAGNFTVVWSAEPGISLFSRQGEVVRATGEAASLLGAPGYRNYPGAERAAAEAYERFGGDDFSGDPGNLTARSGTMFMHLVSMHSTPTNIKAIGCLYNFGFVAEFADDPKVGGPLAGWGFEIDAIRPADAEDPRADRPRGDIHEIGDRAPRFDAFSPWQVSYKGVRFDDIRLSRCADHGLALARSHPAYRDSDLTDDTVSVSLEPVQRDLIPVLPQYPTWPSP